MNIDVILSKNERIKCKVMSSFYERARGLMFRSKATCLFFEFEEGRIRNAIHSFFCPTFLAVFADRRKKIVDKKIVFPFHAFIVPKKKFKFLLEVPISLNKNFKIGSKLRWKNVRK